MQRSRSLGVRSALVAALILTMSGCTWKQDKHFQVDYAPPSGVYTNVYRAPTAQLLRLALAQASGIFDGYVEQALGFSCLPHNVTVAYDCELRMLHSLGRPYLAGDIAPCNVWSELPCWPHLHWDLRDQWDDVTNSSRNADFEGAMTTISSDAGKGVSDCLDLTSRIGISVDTVAIPFPPFVQFVPRISWSHNWTLRGPSDGSCKQGVGFDT